MNPLAAVRRDLVEALAGLNVSVFDHIPESMTAPAVVLAPGSPYIDSDGEPFGHYRVAYTLIVVADVATNEVATAELDDLLVETLGALGDSGYPAEDVSEPYVYQSNTALHIAADLTVSASIHPRKEC